MIEPSNADLGNTPESVIEYMNALEQQNQELKAQVEQLQKIAKEEAHDAYYEASDKNRCDRWSDTFDEDIKAEFEEYWNKNKIDENFKIEPARDAEIKAQAVREFIKSSIEHFDGCNYNINRMTVNCYLNDQLRLAAKAGK